MPRLPETAARRLLGSARVARLASTTEQGRPHIVPVTFAVDGSHIYIAVDAKPKTTAKPTAATARRVQNVLAISDLLRILP